MKKLKAIFLVCVLAGVIGCFCEDCTPYGSPALDPFYINNSGVTVMLTYDHFTKEIENNGILCNDHINESCSNYWYIPPSNKGDSYIKTFYASTKTRKPAYFKIEFLAEPKVCLVFDGGDKVEKSGRIHYSYTITPEHKAMAREEDCLSLRD